MKYADESISSGDVAQETFTFDMNIKNTPAEIKNIVFGCGRDNQCVFDPKIIGIVGLGNSPTSLASQLGVENFSYCLPGKLNFPSLLNFGEKAVISGPGTVSTPLLPNSSHNYYYLNLKGISVAGKRIDIFNQDGNAGSGMVLDNDIVLNQDNKFGLVDDLMCFMFDIDDKIGVFGNTVQINFLIGIDRQKKVVSFKPTTCRNDGSMETPIGSAASRS
ncbi:unnamed protein product [Lupinus luteus]|uniref:Xylanase inhibitor N-terminal domain-containing protein n=1 Tax=Lupinus luteus TaxID=3873 RepID=A0AAV1XHR5_LUPLU